jgi:hypothetical protein
LLEAAEHLGALAVETLLSQGIEKAMGAYNGIDLKPSETEPGGEQKPGRQESGRQE